jgi:hypothetical protein
MEYEGNPQIKRIWERCLEYELGHLQFVAELFENTERRDASEVLSRTLPAPIRYESHREFIRNVLRTELHLSAADGKFVDRSEETEQTREYRRQMNSEGSPSDTVAASYVWTPGTELSAPAYSRR